MNLYRDKLQSQNAAFVVDAFHRLSFGPNKHQTTFLRSVVISEVCKMGKWANVWDPLTYDIHPLEVVQQQHMNLLQDTVTIASLLIFLTRTGWYGSSLHPGLMLVKLLLLFPLVYALYKSAESVEEFSGMDQVCKLEICKEAALCAYLLILGIQMSAGFYISVRWMWCVFSVVVRFPEAWGTVLMSL